ncbi:MAG: lipoprotein [Pseudomonadota bacterium]|nr:lipoprotein [Pseudomonadota bacterium]
MYKIPLFILILVAVVQLLACGQKGPLYMPDEKQDEQQQTNQQKQQKS